MHKEGSIEYDRVIECPLCQEPVYIRNNPPGAWHNAWCHWRPGS